MLLTVHAAAAYDLPAETFVLLMVEPPLQGPGHRVRDERLVTTTTPLSELWNDLHGNPQRRLLAPKGRFSFEFTATVEADPNVALRPDAAEHPPREIPAEAMVYTLPSRYCQSDLLARMAHSEFGHLRPGGGRVLGIAEWVRRHVEYRHGTTDARTSAYDTATERVGVCRDFAHLTIAFCRALGVPARYVSAYALGLEPPDFHGYVQVYLGGGWHNVDATYEGVRPALVPIAVGRDAADVAMTTLWGQGTLREQSVAVREVVDDRPGSTSPTHRGSGEAILGSPDMSTDRIAQIGTRHGFGAEAARTLWLALQATGGGLAQFDHPELGGRGQWMPGMTMIGTMSDAALKARVEAICVDLAALVADRGEPATSQGQARSRTGLRAEEPGGAMTAMGSMRPMAPMRPMEPLRSPAPWWPEGLGQPTATGGQDDLSYAYFAGPRRLAIWRAGERTIYDTADHRIGGVGQRQGGNRQGLVFTSQHGEIPLASLTVVGP